MDIEICRSIGHLRIIGVNGVIIITTKGSKFIVKDFSDGSPVAGATVYYIAHRQE